jgi:hypothetical protein
LALVALDAAFALRNWTIVSDTLSGISYADPAPRSIAQPNLLTKKMASGLRSVNGPSLVNKSEALVESCGISNPMQWVVLTI